ncbi:MAG: helix-hairpin-helix domain-containing protein [Coriobacteriia bacterium]
MEEDGGAIRVGLGSLLHMTSRLLEKVAVERSVRPFDDRADFLARTRAGEPAARSLIRVGALDGLGVTDAGRPPTRDEMLALLPELRAVIACRIKPYEVARNGPRTCDAQAWARQARISLTRVWCRQ